MTVTEQLFLGTACGFLRIEKKWPVGRQPVMKRINQFGDVTWQLQDAVFGQLFSVFRE